MTKGFNVRENTRAGGDFSVDELYFELDRNEELPHFHNEMEIVYVLSGRATAAAAGVNFAMAAEDFAVFNQYERHSLYREPGGHVLSMCISPELLRYAGIGRIRCCSPLNAGSADYLRLIRIKLALLYRGSIDKRERLYMLSQLFGLLAVLKQEFEISDDDGAGRVAKDERGSIVSALRYIGENYEKGISLGQVAEHVYMSKSHLSRAFRKQMDMSFTEYMQALRLNMAIHMLGNTSKSVTDIALKIGFANVNTFITNFKRVYGYTPGEYRRRMLLPGAGEEEQNKGICEGSSVTESSEDRTGTAQAEVWEGSLNSAGIAHTAIKGHEYAGEWPGKAQADYTRESLRILPDRAEDVANARSGPVINAQSGDMSGCDAGFKSRPVLGSAAKPYTGDKISYMSLLRYAPLEDYQQPLTKRIRSYTRINTDACDNLGSFRSVHREAISTGWAEGLLQENTRNALREAKRRLGFKYATFHGLLDDAMEVYHEDENGRPWLNFTYTDMVLDFLVSIDVLPWLEFGYTPQKLTRTCTDDMFGESNIYLPEDLKKWQYLVEGLMRHIGERYGEERTRNWRYSPSAALFASFNIFSMEEYLPYYRATFESIRKCLPYAVISGCTLDTGFLSLEGPGKLEQFLKYCLENNCLPNMLSLQCMQSDYSRMDPAVTGRRINGKGELHMGEPSLINRDPDILEKELSMAKEILESLVPEGMPIVILSWNSTHWKSDLGNDTCYKSAYIFSRMLKNSGALNAMVYCHLTDHTERKIVDAGIFHGGTGLVTYLGVPKAAYYAYELLRHMDGIVVSEGEGYLATRSADGKRISIGLYNYCHINEKTHISEVLPEEEQASMDRYYGYEDKGVRVFSIYLTGLAEGYYSKETHTVSRKSGSSYDVWMEMGAPRIMMPRQIEYLKMRSVPGYSYERVRVGAGEELLVSAVLDAHEIRVIRIEKQ